MSSKVSVYLAKDWNMNWVIILFSPRKKVIFFADTVLFGTPYTIADPMQIIQEGEWTL